MILLLHYYQIAITEAELTTILKAPPYFPSQHLFIILTDTDDLAAD